MKTYLVEAYSEKVKFGENGNIISLTPEACYQLDKAGIKYSIPEDYYDEVEFLKEEESYFKSQLAWFDKFDNFLFSIFPYAKKMKLKLVTQYYLFLKTMVDPVIFRSKMLRGFIEKANPQNIIYISKRSNEEEIDFTLSFTKSESLFSRLTPLICQKYSITFSRVILEKEGDTNKEISRNINFVGIWKDKLKRNKCIRNMYFLFKTGIIFEIFSYLFKQGGLHIFLLKSGYGSRELIEVAIKQGHKVFMKSDREILSYSPLGIRKHCKIKKNNNDARILPEFKGDNKKIKEYLDNQTKILNWINEQCGIDVSNIVLPRIKHFIEVICPEILSLMGGYVKFYKENHIDFVITPHQWEVEEYTAIAATKYSKGTKSVCIQHGNDVFNAPMRDFGELKPYDIYLSTDKEYTQTLNSVNLQFDCETKIIPSFSYRLNQFSAFAQKRVKEKKMVVYIPTFFIRDSNALCGDACYYKWQKRLLEFFASQKDFHFIWKTLPSANQIYDPIPNLIQDKEYKNIKYATEPFVKWIKKADLLLLDYPSTALYEGAVNGLPVMSLYFAPFNVIRESALKLFGKSLQPFNNFDEGIARIENFLKSNPDEFIISIPRSEISILDILKSLKINE